MIVRVEVTEEELVSLGKRLGASDVGSVGAALRSKIEEYLKAGEKADRQELNEGIQEALKVLDLKSLKAISDVLPKKA